MSGDANDEKGFVIKDKRLFDEEGKTREEDVTGEEKTPPEEKPAPEEKPEPPPRKEAVEREADVRDDAGEKGARDEEFVLPEMNFPTFILSLHTSALFHLGLISDPQTSETVKNLPAAKQTIDILDMLEKKTKGNLDEEERKLLEGILFELKMAYVKSN